MGQKDEVATANGSSEPPGKSSRIAQVAAFLGLLFVVVGPWVLFALVPQHARKDTLGSLLVIAASVVIGTFVVKDLAATAPYEASRISLVFGTVVGVSAIVAYFATAYWLLGVGKAFSQELSKPDAIFVALGTLSTAATGNIYAVSEGARALQAGQMVLDLVLVLGVIAIAVSQFSALQPRQVDAADEGEWVEEDASEESEWV